MSKKIGVFFDDVYKPDQIPPYISAWVVIDNFEEFKKFILEYWERNKTLPFMTLDGCLNTEQEIYMSKKMTLGIIRREFKGECGLDVVDWLIQFCKEKEITWDTKVCVHDTFGEMRTRMFNMIFDFQKEQGIIPTVFDFKWQVKQ